MQERVPKRTLTDDQLAEEVIDFLKANRDATRRDVIAKCRTSGPRLVKLVKAGVIPYIPEAMTRAQSASRGSHKTPWRKFKLPGSPGCR